MENIEKEIHKYLDKKYPKHLKCSTTYNVFEVFIKRVLVEWAMNRTKDNQTATARILGINRNTVGKWRKT